MIALDPALLIAGLRDGAQKLAARARSRAVTETHHGVAVLIVAPEARIDMANANRIAALADEIEAIVFQEACPRRT